MTQSITKPTRKIRHLENGDHLTRLEFETRYQQMPHVKKAELIEGIVYMGSPLRINKHGAPHANIMGWLGFYSAYTNGVQLGDNCTVRLDPENEPQPDALLRIETGGQSIISEDGYVEGTPELVVEIAASTVSIDLHDKFKAYRRNQVQEYLVWRVEDDEFDWFRLKEEKYIKLQPDEKGIIKSQVYHGLWLDINALLRGDLAAVLELLQQGIATPEHQNFVIQLSKSRDDS
ncbi:Uma2 family endonuclease [Crocosphaera sp. UHCC 0190]|uniref:Uma2 family endonuclease n=1 Tax=Crocosphaera sp. UHCC 0190 TaxID=3110246 RepID=UPI002B20FE71|nr:Uma2 family endonuclease [Crocosphaera sp. UHCC 0190]MEA5511185.1 Uma2 family endonuclease [Crocosphaera sp. UHCC 0190]